eukprot:313078-Rhodomonas_salina.1
MLLRRSELGACEARTAGWLLPVSSYTCTPLGYRVPGYPGRSTLPPGCRYRKDQPEALKLKKDNESRQPWQSAQAGTVGPNPL